MENKLQGLIKDFDTIREDFLSTLDKFPKDKISEKLFGEWNIKDVIAHFVGWNIEFTRSLKAFMKGEKPLYWGKIYEFNDKIVKASENKSWEEVLKEFEDSGLKFIETYKIIPGDLVEEKLWKDKIYTPKRLLEINIHHYEKAQLIKIQEYLQKWKLDK